MKRAVFVCTGNTCRSPMAEGLFREYLKSKNTDGIEVSSAGLACFSGDEPCKNAVTAAAELSADISSHRSRALTAYDFTENTYFLCMTEVHENIIKKAFPNAKTRVLDIPDPYGGSLETYRKTALEIQKRFDGILEFLSGAKIEIFPMTEDDIKSIALIEKECFSEPWSEKSLSEELENPVACFFTAKIGGETAGYIGSFNVVGEVSITNVAVSEKFRKRGVAIRLLEHLEKVCREKNAEFITLEVRQSNENAISLYKKCGFCKVGERKNFYSHPTENAVLMTKTLK